MLFELPHFDYVEAMSANEAAFWLEKCGGKAAILAGGTDLLALMKERITGPAMKTPETLVSIKNIPELKQIAHGSDATLRIGASVTLSQLLASALVTELFPMLLQAARQVGSTQIRNLGTIGGNVCQRPRCVYFRHPHFVCFKKGGDRCFAEAGQHEHYHSIFKLGACKAAHPSDLAPSLLALKAKVIVVSPHEEREVPLAKFFAGPDDRAETVLAANELVAGFAVPDKAKTARQVFLKERVRKSIDFALCSVAASAVIVDGICEDISMVLGGVAASPYIAASAEAVLRGKHLDSRLVSQATEAAIEGAWPLPMNVYKVDLIRALVKNALVSITEPRGQSV